MAAVSAPASASTPDPSADDEPSSPREHPWPRWGLTALLLGLAALCVPEHVQAGDAGEMATVMLEGGIPHPSGYPWMRALGLPAPVSYTHLTLPTIYSV